jgi:hypothetical protein
MSYERKLKSILLLCIATAFSMFLASCSEEKKTEAIGQKVYDFLANAGDAQINTTTPSFVKFGEEFAINNDKRAILFEHPNSEVRFDGVAIPANAVLHFGIGINQTAWDKSGDGVTFEITVADEKSTKTMIFSEYIDPKKNSNDKKWFDYNLDLKAFAGQKVSFTFTTSPGPGNDNAYDWAGWSDPQIALKSKQS